MENGELPNIKPISELLKVIESSDNAGKCQILKYIYSNFSTLEKLPGHKDHDLDELCTKLIDIITSGDQQYIKLMEVCDYLLVYLFENKSVHLNFFHKLLGIQKKRRIMIFLYFEACHDSTIEKLISNDSGVLHFLSECMQSVRTDAMPWLAKENVENIKMLRETDKLVLPQEQEREELLIHYALSLLTRIYRMQLFCPGIQCHKFNVLLMDKVMMLAYMGYKRQRTPALKLLQQALQCNVSENIRKNLPDAWNNFKDNIKSVYCLRMKALVLSPDLEWTELWTFSIKFLGTDLHKGSGLVNSLLSVEEAAFKSSDSNIRMNAFICWNVLIDNFALDPRDLSTPRRVKLLCIPLNANNSKIELISTKKLEVWWHLINKVFHDLVKFNKEIIFPFLSFCFSPFKLMPNQPEKVNACPSPGKRFMTTKLAAIDALLQLLVMNREDLKCFKPVLKERIPRCINVTVFQQIFQTLLYSVFEAIFVLEELNEKDLKNRKQIIIVLWNNLMKHIENTSKEIKIVAYKDLILALTEFCNNISQKIMLVEILMETILISLGEHANNLIFNDNSMMDLVLNLFPHLDLSKMDRQHFTALKDLLQSSMKMKTITAYNAKALEIMSKIIDKLKDKSSTPNSEAAVTKMWIIIAELATVYMEDSQNINEGTALAHNFKTIKSIVNFPLVDLCITESSDNILRAGKVWRILYNRYESQAELIITVKAKEILNETVKTIEENIRKDCQRWPFIAHCINVLIGSLNSNELTDEIPPIAKILNDITESVLEKNQKPAIHVSLKSLNSFLNLVTEISNSKRKEYLKALKPAIHAMLKYKSDVTNEKEMILAWEKVVNILKGLEHLFNNDLLEVYRDIIILAARHEKDEIAQYTIHKLMTVENMNSDAKETLSKIWAEIQIFSKAEKELEEKSEKKVFKFGSFRNRLGSNSKTKQPENNTKKEKKICHLILDPDTEDFVPIESEYNFDYNRLTEHQKEKFKQKRDDIPALYNELSQSVSQDSNQVQHWFEAQSKKSVTEKQTTEPTINKETVEKEIPNKNIDENTAFNSNQNISPEFSNQASSENNVETNVAKKLNFEEDEEKTEKENTGEQQEREKNVEAQQPSSLKSKPAKRKLESDGTHNPEPHRRKSVLEMSRLKIDMVFDSELPAKRKPKVKKDMAPFHILRKRRSTPIVKYSSKQKNKYNTRQNTSINEDKLSESQSSRKEISRRTDEEPEKKPEESQESQQIIQETQSQDDDIVESSQANVSNLPSANIEIATSSPIPNKSLENTNTNSPDSNNKCKKALKNAFLDDNMDHKKENEKIIENKGNKTDSGVSNKISIDFECLLRGRTAQMMGLVNQGDGEKERWQALPRKTVIKENDDKVKKDKAGLINLKDHERISSPSGSRQEKIFKKIQEIISSPSSTKLFSNLKNDGEKVSPKLDQIAANAEGNDVLQESFLPLDDIELPILEWSSANPPSLNASPSCSILKRSNVSLVDFENEFGTPGKRKRVSFADPPVSKKMRYEVASSDSPNKICRMPCRAYHRDTPYKSKPTKLKFSQVESMDSNVHEKDVFEVSAEDDLENQSFDLSRKDPVVSKPVSMSPEKITPKIISKPQTVVFDILSEATSSDVNAQVNRDSVTQDDIFENDDSNEKSKEDLTADSISSMDDDTLSKTLVPENESSQNSSVEKLPDNPPLDDTVDIHDLTGISLTSESNEKLRRTSTKINEITPESDTVLATESMFVSSGTFSLDSQNLQSTETFDVRTPVYEDLIGCQEPVKRIIDQLTNPLWVNHLLTHLAAREITTVGQLAELTLAEVNRLPIKGTSKYFFLRVVLERFEKTLEDEAEMEKETTPKKSTDLKSTNSALLGLFSPEDVKETVVNDVQKTKVAEPSVPDDSSLGITEKQPHKKYTARKRDTSTCDESTNKVESVSVAVCTEPQKFSTVGCQTSVEDFLDKYDPNILLQSIANRCTPETTVNILQRLLTKIAAKHANNKKAATNDGIANNVLDSIWGSELNVKNELVFKKLLANSSEKDKNTMYQLICDMWDTKELLEKHYAVMKKRLE